MTKPHWGLIGLATMGENLARNFAGKSIPIVVFNRTSSKTDDFIARHGNENLTGFSNINDFVAAIESPRRIILLVKAGEAVDEIISELVPLLNPGDVILDGGNSYFRDTERRQSELETKGIKLIGIGISGGAEGALHGPSMMPGGELEVVNSLLPELEKVAARDFEGGPAVIYIGPGGSGHLVKMVHNGIEYAIMQMIAESYDFLKSHGQTNEQIAATLDWLNTGDTESYLLEISAKILRTKADSNYLVDLIKDEAGDKGTGKWTIKMALDLGVAVPTLAAGMFARFVSSEKQRRGRLAAAANEDSTSPQTNLSSSSSQINKNLFTLAALAAYSQGFQLLAEANEAYKLNLNIPEICRIWQGGCIIRSRLLAKIHPIIKQQEDILGSDLARSLNLAEASEDLAQISTPKPALSSAIEYLKGIYQANSPANLIQAQRDYFGQHTYGRTDKEGVFTGGWGEESVKN